MKTPPDHSDHWLREHPDQLLNLYESSTEELPPAEEPTPLEEPVAIEEPAEELAPLAMGRPGRLLRMMETGELERRRRWAECLSRGEGRELVEEACSDPQAFLEFLQEWLRDRLMEALEMPEACLWPGRAPGRGGGGARLAELVWEVHRCRGLLERNVNRRLLMEHLLVEVGA